MALIRVVDQPFQYELSFLLERVQGSRWVVAGADGELSVDDLAVEEVVPLTGGQEYPLLGRPFSIREVVTEPWLAGLRASARSLADLHGAEPATAGPITVAGSSWRFADSAHESFGTQVSDAHLGRPLGCHMEGSTGIILDPAAEGGGRWTFVERVADGDVSSWLEEKRVGAGRDQRLAPTHQNAKAGTIPLFRDARDALEKDVTPMAPLFDGPCATEELVDVVASSGLEPLAFANYTLTDLGAGTKSSHAAELRSLLFTLHLMLSVDRLNGPRLASAEHVSRRSLQILKAITRNPRAPDFTGLSFYLSHMGATVVGMRTPLFDKHITELQKNEAFTLKQTRLMREEVEHRRKAGGAATPVDDGGGEGGRGRGRGKRGRGGRGAAGAEGDG